MIEFRPESRLDLKSFQADEFGEPSPLFGANPGVKADPAAVPATGSNDFMQKSLPVLSLPAHTLDLVITEADSDDEKIRNLSATVMHHPGSSDQPARIDVSDLKADMPRGDLAGSIELATADEWTARLQAEIVTRSREPEQLKGLESTDWLWTSGQPAQTGIAIPDIGFWQSQLKIDARLTADQVKMPGVTLSGVDLLLIHCCCSAENAQ